MNLVQTEHRVGAGELAEVLQCSTVVCSGSLDFVVEGAEVDFSTIDSDGCSPWLTSPFVVHSFESGSAEGDLAVGLILGIRGYPQVRSAVVEAISIDVIDLEAFRTSDETVHGDAFADGVPMMPRPLSAPGTSLQEREIGIVYDGDLALGQSDLGHVASPLESDRVDAYEAATSHRPCVVSHDRTGGL